MFDELKSSNSSSFDCLPPVLFKKLKSVLAPKIILLTNKIIEMSNYPEIFKYSKAIPLLKFEKPELEPQSYHLINIQITSAKIIDTYFNSMAQLFKE